MALDIKPFIKDAQKLEQETGIPTSVTLAQMIQESSGSYAGGLSGLAHDAKNLFGIKGTGDAGSVSMPTHEVIDGVTKTVNATFKKYSSFYASLVDHAKVLSNSRYHLDQAKSINDYVHNIKAGGYATDPNYENALLGIINSRGLNKYNVSDFKFKPVTASGDNSSGEIQTPTIPLCQH